MVRAIVDAVPPDTLGQYATFSGPQLESIVRYGSVALLGDASHRECTLRASPRSMINLRQKHWLVLSEPGRRSPLKMPGR